MLLLSVAVVTTNADTLLVTINAISIPVTTVIINADTFALIAIVTINSDAAAPVANVDFHADTIAPVAVVTIKAGATIPRQR